MKKILLIFGFVLIGISLLAQFQRKVAETGNITGASLNNEKEINSKYSRNSVQQKGLKELKLSSEQKVKLKEMKVAKKSKRDEIISAPALTEDQKRMKLSQFKRAVVFDLKGILTNEQTEKMKIMHAEKLAIPNQQAKQLNR